VVDLKSKIREVPDFPTPGIGFKDIMPLLADADALRDSVDRMGEWAEPRSPEIVLGGELAQWFAGRGLVAHVTVTDESDYAAAFVIIEQQT